MSHYGDILKDIAIKSGKLKTAEERRAYSQGFSDGLDKGVLLQGGDNEQRDEPEVDNEIEPKISRFDHRYN